MNTHYRCLNPNTVLFFFAGAVWERTIRSQRACLALVYPPNGLTPTYALDGVLLFFATFLGVQRPASTGVADKQGGGQGGAQPHGVFEQGVSRALFWEGLVGGCG